jgi:hypothetical protein
MQLNTFSHQPMVETLQYVKKNPPVIETILFIQNLQSKLLTLLLLSTRIAIMAIVREEPERAATLVSDRTEDSLRDGTWKRPKILEFIFDEIRNFPFLSIRAITIPFFFFSFE